MWFWKMNSKMARRDDPRGRAGFTLVELLVAVAVLSIMIGMAYGSFYRVSEAVVRIESHIDLNHTSRFIISRMTDDLASASLLPNSPGGFFLGEPQYPEEEGNLDKISFTGYGRRLVTPGTASDLAVITWFVVKAPESDTYTLMRSEHFNTLNDLGPEELMAPAFDITDRLVSFDISYLSLDGGSENWVDGFDSKAKNTLPEMIRLKFVLKDDKGGEVESSAIFLIGEKI